MNDPNKPAVKAHNAAVAHLQPLQANRDAVQAQTLAWTPNASQTAGDDVLDPSVEADQ